MGGLYSLELTSLSFGSISDSNAIEGAALYLEDCYDVTIDSCSFVGQETSIRGGAVYIRQGTDYFGSEFDSSKTTLIGTTFDACKSQQGSCLFLDNVRDSEIDGCIFADAIAYKYDDGELEDPQADLDSRYLKTYEAVADGESGTGPAIYFGCDTSDGCSLTVIGAFGRSTSITNCLVYDYTTDSSWDNVVQN